MTPRHHPAAFTLIEVLIVLTLLGILAAIVIPQYATAGDSAKLESLKTTLATVRGQIELYKLQHDETYPTSSATLADQLTLASKADGSTAAVGTSGFNFGPYVLGGVMPDNPVSGANAVGSGGVGTSDWYYDGSTGTFRANNDAAYTGY